MISITGQQVSNDFEHGSAASNCGNFLYTKLMLWIDKQRDRQYMIHNDIGIVYNFQKHLKPTYHSWILKEANYIYKFRLCCTVATNAVQVPRFKWLFGSLETRIQSVHGSLAMLRAKSCCKSRGVWATKRGCYDMRNVMNEAYPSFTQV